MQRKESDNRINNVFGLRCLRILLNRLIFIRDKNEEIFFKEREK